MAPQCLRPSPACCTGAADRLAEGSCSEPGGESGPSTPFPVTKPGGWGPSHCGHPRAPPWTPSPSQAFGLKASPCLLPTSFSSWVGNPWFQIKRTQKFTWHFSSTCSPTGDFRESPRASLGSMRHTGFPEPGMATGLSAFALITDQLGGAWGDCRDEAPTEGIRAATMSIFRVLCAQCSYLII